MKQSDTTNRLTSNGFLLRFLRIWLPLSVAILLVLLLYKQFAIGSYLLYIGACAILTLLVVWGTAAIRKAGKKEPDAFYR